MAPTTNDRGAPISSHRSAAIRLKTFRGATGALRTIRTRAPTRSSHCRWCRTTYQIRGDFLRTWNWWSIDVTPAVFPIYATAADLHDYGFYVLSRALACVRRGFSPRSDALGSGHRRSCR
jgi:hypothetical protein